MLYYLIWSKSDGVEWCGMVGRGVCVVLCGGSWCGVSDVVWCGGVWCGVVWGGVPSVGAEVNCPL